jgi:hypothetical protein
MRVRCWDSGCYVMPTTCLWPGLVIITGLDMYCTVLSIMVSLLLLLLFFLLYLLLLLLLSQLLACFTDFPRGLYGKVKAASRDGHIRILS